MAHWIVIFAYLAATTTTVALGLYVGWARRTPPARAFLASMLAVGLWQLTWATLAIVPDEATKFFLANVRIGIASFTVLTSIAFVEQFTPDQRRLSPRGWALLGAVPIVTLGLGLTSPFHQLLRRDLRVEWSTGLVQSSPGPFMLPYLALTYVGMIYVFWRLVRATRTGPRAQRRLATVIAIGTVPNMLGDLSFTLGFQPLPGMSIGPLMMGVGGIAFAVALLRYRAFELDPLVRLGVVDLMDDAMLIVDRHGLLVEVNRAARALVGDAPDDGLLGRPAREVLPELARALDAIEAGAQHVPDVQVSGPGGARVFDVRASPLVAGGRTQGSVLLFHDLTDRARREDQVRQHAARLEELDRLKDGLLATVSHELRTPLASVLGLTDAVLDEELSVEVRRYVTNMRASGEMLHALINDLLDLAKAKSGKLTLDEAPFQLAQVVETVAEFFVVPCRRKGLEFDWYFPSDPPALVGDAHRLRQILMNLVGNSVKYTATGSITVKAAWKAGELTLEIADTGPGIPPGEREHVFDEFTQLDSSPTRRAGGAGLGLAIVKRLVTLMNGQVKVEANGDAGSLFTVKVPVRAGDPVPREGAGSLVRTVALFAPKPLRRALLADALRATGERVLEASTFEALLERATGGLRPSAIWIDAAAFDPAWHEALRGEGSPLASVPLVIELEASDGALEKLLHERWNPVETLHRPAWTRELADVLQRARRRRARPATGPSAAVRELPPPPGDGPRRRLLVVDDAHENQVIVAAYLKNHPYDLEFAGNGAVAVEAFQRTRFDAVLLDLDMPVMDGHTALRHMRAWEQAQGRAPIPIVAVTAHSGAEFARTAVAEGFTRALFKPTRKKEFLEAIHRLFAPVVETPTSVPVLAVRPPGPVIGDEDPEITRLRLEYLRTLAALPAKLREAQAAGDLETVRRLGHKLFGTAGTYELDAIADVGRSIEEAAKAGAPGLSGLVDALEKAVEARSRG